MSAMSELAVDLEEQQQQDDPAMYEPSDTGTPFNLDGVDDDILADFAAIGITIRGAEDEAGTVRADAFIVDGAQRHTMAATFLRRAAEADAEIELLKATMLQQIELVTAHYARVMEIPAARRDRYNRIVEDLALQAIDAGDFGKKKKSASTPFGEFGVRDKAEGIDLVDEAALLAHLREHAPAFVRVTSRLPLTEAREFLSPSELEKAKMEAAWGDLKKTLTPKSELPPGVAVTPASRTPFAKPFMPFTGAAAVPGITAPDGGSF